jgi:hypothetical protein
MEVLAKYKLLTVAGYDNGVMGGLVNQPAFINTFNNPGPTMVGLIVSLYEGTTFALEFTWT